MTPAFPCLYPDPFRGPYRLVERIGAGGSGEVFRAEISSRSTPLREVCVKRLAARFGESEARAELREEARLLARVRHANVVSLFAAGEDGTGAPYLVLELVRGCELGRLGRLEAPLAVRAACAVLGALAAVSRATPGLVHRDVSPHNVLVSNEGEVKLADFGIALSEGRARWTLPNCVKGKVGYMAPEQLRGEPLDARTDLYAVGVVLYELISGERPCAPARGMDELRATASGLQRPLAARAPSVPAALAEAVDRLCASDRGARFRHPEEAISALAPFGSGDAGASELGRLVRTHAHSGAKRAESSATILMETQRFVSQT